MLNKRGFSLIELLVVITITAMMFGGGMMAYSNIQKDQGLAKATKQVRAALYKARQEALLGRLNPACVDEFNGKSFSVSADGKQLIIRSECGLSSGMNDEVIDLEPGVVVTSSGGYVLFTSLTMGTNITAGSSTTFTISYSGDTETVTVESGGEIK